MREFSFPIFSRHFLTCGATAAVMLALPAEAAFTGLGFAPGGRTHSISTAISADGSTVVGYSAYPNADGDDQLISFKWSAAGGMTLLPLSNANAPASYANAMSADGSVIVGTEVQQGGATIRAFRYANGVIELLQDPSGNSLGGGLGISADGTVVTGMSSSAFRWTAGGGTVPLPALPGQMMAYANAASADGGTIVGTAIAGNGTHAFRWTEAGGTQALPLSVASESGANAVSADGGTIAGYYVDQATGAETAYVWTSQGLVVLSPHDTNPAAANNALALSADGLWAGGESSGKAAIWNALTGELILVENLLAAEGTPGLAGWTLESVTGMSADGHSFTGTGTNPDGNIEAWHASVTAIPEPSTLPLLLLGCCVISRRNRVR